jgi:transposase-like protein
MDRDQLRRWLDDGLSLKQIGAIVGRDPSTVGYWVRKHGLVANGRGKYAPRGGVRREELESLVAEGRTFKDMANALDRSISTIRYWLAKHRLGGSSAPPGRRPLVSKTKVDAALQAGSRTLLSSCVKHGSTVFVIENSGRVRCRKCRMERVTEWRRRTKRRLVEEAGGCCRLCGYDRCMAALQFHHRNPSEKSFPMSLQGVPRRLEVLRREAVKCVLLCANCHAEVEVGLATLPDHIARPD